MDLRLTVTSGQRQLLGDVYQVDVNSDIFSIGRSADNTWVLPDARLHISSKHCVIHKKNDEYHLTDISTNGVFINGEDDPIGRGRTVILKNADALTIGEFIIRVDLQSPFDEPASADIDDLLTPDITDETTPEFSEILDQVVASDEREVAASEIDELLAPRNGHQASETPSVSELMRPVSPEREQFKPPEAKKPISDADIHAPEGQKDATTSKQPPQSIPDNWLDMLGQSSGEDKTGASSADSVVPTTQKATEAVSSPQADKPVETNVGSVELTPTHTRTVEIKPASSVEADFEELIETASSNRVKSPDTRVKGAQVPASHEASLDAARADNEEKQTGSIVEAALALLNDTPVVAKSGGPNVVDSEQGAEENELAALLNRELVQSDENVTYEGGVEEEPLAMPEITVENPEFETVTIQPTPGQDTPSVDDAVVEKPVAEKPSLASSAPIASLASRPEQSGLFEEFLEAAGIPVALIDGKDKSQLAQEMGAMIKNYSQGVVETLATRSLVKSEFRLQQTMIRPVDNNPLKFSPSGSEALKIMMLADSAAYMSAPKAVDEGFKDIQAHQLAMMSGIQAAFSHLLDRFKPEDLQRKFDRRPRHQKGILGRQRVDYWLEYVDFYEDICTMMEDQFQDLFSAEFGKAYEEQLRSLDK